jgi:hypothetical protein
MQCELCKDLINDDVMTVAMSGTGDVYHFKASFLATRFIWLFELLLSPFVYFLFQFCLVDNDFFFTLFPSKK